jgi:hypothetical protein
VIKRYHFALVLPFLAFGAPSGLLGQGPIGPPDHILYARACRHVNKLNKLADESSAHGKDRFSLGSLVAKQAGLSDAQMSARTLRDAAMRCVADLEVQDSKAKVILDRFHAANYPFGIVPHGVTLPPPPSELIDLQIERNSIVLLARDRLRGLLGEVEFARFDAFVRQRFANRESNGAVRAPERNRQ